MEMRFSLERLENLAFLMDYRFRIPFTRFRVGLDGLLGLIPGIGDFVGLAISVFIFIEAKRLGASGPVLIRMALNVLIDFVIGSIPVLGDVFDFVWKANGRNVRLLRRHLEKTI